MQQVLHYSALKTGVAYIALTLTIIAFSAVAQALVTRVGIRRVLPVGLALSTVGARALRTAAGRRPLLLGSVPGLHHQRGRAGVRLRPDVDRRTHRRPTRGCRHRLGADQHDASRSAARSASRPPRRSRPPSPATTSTLTPGPRRSAPPRSRTASRSRSTSSRPPQRSVPSRGAADRVEAGARAARGRHGGGGAGGGGLTAAVPGGKNNAPPGVVVGYVRPRRRIRARTPLGARVRDQQVNSRARPSPFGHQAAPAACCRRASPGLSPGGLASRTAWITGASESVSSSGALPPDR